MQHVCQELRDDIVRLVEGDLDRATADRLRAHAARCEPCARELSLEQELFFELRALPLAPQIDVGVPETERMPAHGLGLRLTTRWLPLRLTTRWLPLRLTTRRASLRLTTRQLASVVAVAAAAVLVAAVGLHAGRSWIRGSADADIARESADTDRPVEIRTMIESTADVALPDDDLLALTAGVEAVVMRRPAQGR